MALWPRIIKFSKMRNYTVLYSLEKHTFMTFLSILLLATLIQIQLKD
jgi:hypothetical protein